LEKKLDKISNLTSRYEVKMQKLPSQESQLVRLIRQKDVYEKIFTLLLDKREEMRMAEVSKLQDIIVVDPPQKSVLPISPNKRLNLLIAFILGGFIGLLGIFIVELKNSRLIDIDSLEEFVQLPVLSIIPKFGKDTLKRLKNPYENSDKFVTLMDTEPGIKESLRLLKTKLLIQLDNNEKIILITSCEENTGKTTIVSNLAVSFAQEEKKVLVIDCDLRKAELTRTFNIPVDSPGLIDYLTNDSQLQIYNKVMKKIDVVPAGGLTEDSAEILNSAKMLELLNNLEKSDYDYILVDTPPVNWVVDTLVLGRFIKSAVLVVRPLVSFKDSVTTGIKEMRLARIKIRGVIANAAEIEKSYTYKYKYGYGYGYSSKGNSKSSNGFKGKILKITDKSRIKSAS